MSDPESGPEFTLLDSVRAKVKVAERLIETASQQLGDPDLSASKRTELQKIVEDTRVDLRRFRDQKHDLENH